MNTIQRVTSRLMFFLGFLALLYAAIDYTFHPELRGDIANLASGIVAGILILCIATLYLKDAHADNQLEGRLGELEEKLRELDEKAAKKSKHVSRH